MPATTEVTSIRLPTKYIKALDKIAKREDRSRSYLIQEAVEQFVALKKWQEESITLSLKQADAGQFASAKEVARVFSKYAPQ